jgi:hypothetical protein
MLRKLKTNLTKEDLIRPQVDLSQASSSMQAQNSLAGGLVMPVQKQISEVLTQASKPVSDDWKKVGDPTAPAIREMEAIRLMEKQQAEAAAEAQARSAALAPQPLGGAVMDITPPIGGPVLNAPTSADDHARQPYSWMPKPAVDPAPRPDDIPDIWSRPSALDNMTIPTSVPAGVVPKPVEAAQPDPLLAPQQLTPIQSPANISAQPMAMPPEGVIYIPHDPSKTIVSATTIPSLDKPKPVGDFASGAAVSIPHDKALQSLPYSPPAAKPKLSDSPL